MYKQTSLWLCKMCPSNMKITLTCLYILGVGKKNPTCTVLKLVISSYVTENVHAETGQTLQVPKIEAWTCVHRKIYYKKECLNSAVCKQTYTGALRSI